MAVFTRAIGEGKLLNKEMQEIRMADWISMGDKNSHLNIKYGLGIFEMDGYVGHNGCLPGFINIAMYNKSNGAIVIFMLNSQPAEGSASLKIFKEIAEIL